MCIDPHQSGFVGKGGLWFHLLQLIKVCPSHASGKGICSGAKNFGSALLQPARSVCISLSTFLILNMGVTVAQDFIIYRAEVFNQCMHVCMYVCMYESAKDKFHAIFRWILDSSWDVE